jgi:hypothetical protein
VSMSGDGKRGVGHRPQATAPILDSTITSASQFGLRPLLVEPDIAIGIDQSRMT